jgi:membrane-bound lytic murein transglycosylase D
MLLRRHAVVAAAFSVSAMTGCAVTQPHTTDPSAWAQRDDTWTQLRPMFSDQDRDRGVYGAQNYAGIDTARAGAFDFSHPRVGDFLVQFQTRWRDSFSIALSRGGRYLPSMTSILQKEGLPPELVYLPLIESGFRTDAVSHAGAVGPWQIITETARRYGLRIDSYVDERRDPIKSTRAAARYLKDLYDMFGDWHLSLAAYNTGENNISRILERGDADDYWEMSDRGFLCRETRDYVPKFLAALQMAEQPEAFGFDAPIEVPMRYDVVSIDRSLPLSTVARLSAASTEEIRDLNPALRRGVTPPQPYDVRLPKGSKEVFQVAYAELDQELRERPVASRSTGRARGRSLRSRRHKVRRGETIASIADRYDVAPQALIAANGIRHANKIHAGQTLTIPVAAVQSGVEMVASRRGGGRLVD